jgi:hypothetical protein
MYAICDLVLSIVRYLRILFTTTKSTSIGTSYYLIEEGILVDIIHVCDLSISSVNMFSSIFLHLVLQV